MSTISAGDLVSLRSTQHKSTPYLSVLQPAVLLQALVNNASATRGMRSVAYDTGTGSAAGYAVIAAAVAAGVSNDIGTALMLEVVTATGTELVRVKSITGSEASGTLTLAENGTVWANDQVITIKHFFQITPVPPAIRSGVFYKDFDRVFVTDFATEPNPVTIIGPHLAGFLSAGSIAFSLNSSSSYAIADGASISSRAWACVHNGGGSSGISFSSTTAANPTLTITTADTYWLSCTVTDSNGKTQTTYRAIFVYDPAGTQPYTGFTIDNLSADWDSGEWRCNITLTGNLTLADIPDGSLAVLWYQNYFDDVEGYVNMWSPFGDNIIYTGYLWSDNDSDDWQNGTGKASFELISPLRYLDSITDYGTVSLEAKSSPVIWSDYATWLTVGRGIHHILKWDTTILEVCDVRNLMGNVYGVKVLEFTEDTVLQRINSVAHERGVHVKLVCNHIGQLYLTTDSQMLNTANRAALDTVFSITTADISGGVNVTRNNTDTRAFADLDGFTYSHPTSTPFISMIPGYIESTVSYNLPEPRGTGVTGNKQQVLNPAGGQTDCNERVGRKLALENVSPKEIRIDTRGCYLGAFDIVPREGWYNWGVADSALKRQLALNGIRTVCRSVTHRFSYAENRFTGVIQTVEVVLQPEALGPDGIPGNYPTTYPAIPAPSPPIAITAGAFAITYGYLAGGYNLSPAVVVTADRLTFSTGVTAANSGSNLSTARSRTIGLSDTMAYGYFAGGDIGTAGTGHTDITDRITLSTGITAANAVSNLSAARVDVSPVSDGVTYGYFGGGQGPSPTFTTLTTVDRIVFSTGVNSAYGNLFSARDSWAGLSNGSTTGWFMGDQGINTTQRITFSSGTINAISGTAGFPLAPDWPGFASGTLAGYALGGDASGTAEAAVEKLVFATEVGITLGALLSAARFGLGGCTDKTTYIYVAGGGNETPAVVVIADRLTLATDVVAANSASNLSAARRWVGGLTDGWV